MQIVQTHSRFSFSGCRIYVVNIFNVLNGEEFIVISLFHCLISLNYLNITQHPKFQNCLPKVEFITDSLFYYTNSKDPFGKGFKGPIKIENKVRDNKILKKAEKYLSKLKIKGQNVLQHPRNTFVLGFVSNIKCFRKLRGRLLALQRVKYLLTYKCRQDHLELFFSCNKSRGGNNDNPNG